MSSLRPCWWVREAHAKSIALRSTLCLSDSYSYRCPTLTNFSHRLGICETSHGINCSLFTVSFCLAMSTNPEAVTLLSQPDNLEALPKSRNLW